MATKNEEVAPRRISVSKARQNFDQILDQARDQGARFLVERDGQPLAIVLGIEEWENLTETISEMNDSEYLESIKQARAEIERGLGLSLDELKANTVSL